MEWKIDPSHSSVDFAVRYLVTTVHGNFTGLRGSVQVSDAAEGETPELLSFDATFDVTSFQTGIPPRDHHIKGENFLDAEAHPEAKVRLVSLTKDVSPCYLMTVELTLHGVSRTVDLVADAAGPVTDAFGVVRIGATATGRLRRSEFGVDAFPGVIADSIDVAVNVQAVPASLPDDQLPPAK
ncbi:YceI family protein [Streptomyces sp. NPDC055105]|uniref:YceI family protein n=1 Tax=Streptomyces sp. NPDC055105 TaxID=3365719 RepID=UPI0037CFCD6F